MSHVEVRLSPSIAGLLGLSSEASRLPLPEGETCSLRDVLAWLEGQAPGAILEPRSGRPRRHILLYLNRRAVADLGCRVGGGDLVEVDLLVIEGG